MGTKRTQMFARNIYAYKYKYLCVSLCVCVCECVHRDSSRSTNVLSLNTNWITSSCIIFHLLFFQIICVHKSQKFVKQLLCCRACKHDCTFFPLLWFEGLGAGKLECHENAYIKNKMRSSNGANPKKIEYSKHCRQTNVAGKEHSILFALTFVINILSGALFRHQI